MNTGLAERPAAALPRDQVELIKRTVANGATNDELALFLYDCERRGIHPLDKLLHFTKRGGRYTPVTSIDFMRSQAAATGEMAGSDDPVFSHEHEGGHPDAASVTVYRLTQGQRFAYTATARWSEYCPDNAPMWKRMPHTMLGKCAEALALRKAFPQQLAGLYSGEEMDQADNKERETLPAFIPEPPKSLIDVATGEEVPEIERPDAPPGYVYIHDVRREGIWYHVLLPDASGGNRYELKTKLPEIGEYAVKAHNEGVPVRIVSKKAPYLDKVIPFDPSEPPF